MNSVGFKTDSPFWRNNNMGLIITHRKYIDFIHQYKFNIVFKASLNAIQKIFHMQILSNADLI